MSESLADFYDLVVHDHEGARVGQVSQLYLDDATGRPTFVAARTGLFGNKEVLVPLGGGIISDRLLQVPHPAEVIKRAPAPRPDRRMSPDFEAEVCDHYGLAYTVAQLGANTLACDVEDERDQEPT